MTSTSTLRSRLKGNLHERFWREAEVGDNLRPPNRAENSHQPARRRERGLQRFKSPEQAQRFLEPFGPIYDHFAPKRHRLGAVVVRQELAKRQGI